MHRIWLPLLSLFLLACQSSGPQPDMQAAQFDLDPLVTQVVQSQQAQRAAAAQFQTVQTQLLQLANSGTDDNAQAMSAALASAHDDCAQAAVDMSTSIDAVQQTADTLFQQWQIETQVYTDARLKTASEAKLSQASQSYEGLMQVLRQTAGQADPVLADLNTAVDTLQNNPNASAVAARKAELNALANDIGALVQQINSSIEQSGAYIASAQQ